MRKILYLTLLLFSFVGVSNVLAVENKVDDLETLRTTEEINNPAETNQSETSQWVEAVIEEETQSSSSDEENKDNITTDSIDPQAMGGDGSENNPFTVSSYSELKSAIKSGNVDSVTNIKYIQLLADILVNESNSADLAFNRNTEINGIKDPSQPSTPENYWYLNYSAVANGTMFKTGTSGLTITLKNLNLGSDSYSQNTYYGFVRVLSASTTLNVENINYNIQRGSQPFFAAAGYCTLNISGTSSYNSPNTSPAYGGEFVEGFRYVNFKQGSQTNISNYTYENHAFFYMYGAGDLTVTVEKNAVLDMNSSRVYMFYYGAATVNQKLILEDNAKFIYKVRDRAGAQSNVLVASAALDMRLAEGSSFEYLTKSRAINMKKLNVSATDPASFYVGKTEDANNFSSPISAGSITITNTGTSLYQAITNNSVVQSAVSPNNRVTFDSTNYQNKSWIKYDPAMSIYGVSASSTVGNRLSQVLSDVQDFQTNLVNGWTFRTEFILSKTPYSDSDGRLDQTTLTNDFNNQTKPDGVYTFTGEDFSSSDSATRGTLDDVLAQNYYIYGRVSGTSNGGSGSTLWKENVVEVPKHISTVFPMALSFLSDDGPLITKKNDYFLESYSNVPTYITMTKVTTGANSDSTIRLVETLSGDEGLLQLDILAALSNTNTTWSMANDGAGQTLELSPYFETNSKANLSFLGGYTGSFYIEKQVNYQVNFKISQTKP
ncbi:hypothetical protein [Enterococcus alishanensis]